MLAVLLLAVCTVCRLAMRNTYTASFPIHAEGLSPEDLRFSAETPGIVQHGTPRIEDGWLRVPIRPEHRGETFIDLADSAGNALGLLHFRVSRFGTVYDGTTGGFTGDTVALAAFTAFCLAVAAIMFRALLDARGPAFYAYGTSFGGYMLLRYLANHGNPFRKVALRCPAINMQETLLRAIATDEDRANLAAGKPVLAGFDRKVKIGPQFIEALQAVDLREMPFFDYADDILIIHGTADEIVPMEDSAQFADDNVIEFVPIEGADHRFRDPKKMDAAIASIIGFYGL